MENKYQCRSALISNLLNHNLAYMHHQTRIFLRIYLESAFHSILSSTKITQPTLPSPIYMYDHSANKRNTRTPRQIIKQNQNRNMKIKEAEAQSKERTKEQKNRRGASRTVVNQGAHVRSNTSVTSGSKTASPCVGTRCTVIPGDVTFHLTYGNHVRPALVKDVELLWRSASFY